MWDKLEQGVVEAFREAKHPDITALPIDSLEALGTSARAELEALAQRILDESEAQHAAAEAGDWAAFEASREMVRRLQEDWEGLQEEIQGIEEIIRRKHLDAKVVARLGSRGRAILLEAIILSLIGVVLGMLVWEAMVPVEVFQRWETPLAILDTAICAIFLWEFFWKMSLADSAGWYFKRHWIDFVSSLPVALLGWGLVRVGRVARLGRVLRVARMARMLRFMRLLRALRGLAFVFRGFDKITKSFNVKVLNRPLLATAIFLVLGGLAMGMAEPETFINDYDSQWLGGLWWSFATVCTGGFADIHDPTTHMGRGLTVLLVILGAILTGAFTAALASVLLGDDTERIERKLGAVLSRMEANDEGKE